MISIWVIGVTICGINLWLWKRCDKLETELLREQSKVWIYECAYPEAREDLEKA